MIEQPARGGSLPPQSEGRAEADESGPRAPARFGSLRRRPAPSTVGFVFALVLGLAVRLLALPTALGVQNSDHSVVYLMARHVADGDFPVFYWGQQYGGTLIQLTAGALFRLIGSSFVGLQVVEIGFWVAACLLLRSIVANAGGVLAGNAAGALLWLASPVMVTFSFSDPGFYGPAVVLGLCAVRIAQSTGSPRRLAVAAIGLCAGLALWTTPLALALVLPSAIWVGMRVRSLGSWLVGIGSAIVGASPWLWANMNRGFASLERQPSADDMGLLERYWRVFIDLVPAILGQSPASAQGRAVAAAFLLASVAGLAIAFWRHNAAIVLLCIPVFLAPAIVAVSGVLVVSAAGRYAALLVPAVAGVLGWAVGRHWAVALLAVGLVSAWSVTTLWNRTDGFQPIADPTFGTEVKQLGTYLERNERSAIWADYWVAYLVTAATEERVTAAAIAPPIYRRERNYELAAMRAPQTTIVLFAGKDNDVVLRGQEALPPRQRTIVGPYAVWHFADRVDVPAYLTAIPHP